MMAHHAPTCPDLQTRVKDLVRCYEHVHHERMQGIPLLNPALQVEAVGFEWATTSDTPPKDTLPVAQGVLITPWFMSLVRLPAIPQPHAGRVGRRAVHGFGKERFDFLGAYDPDLGFHESCALFSPMASFPSQTVARATAQEVMQQLTQPDPPSVSAPPAVPVPARRAFFTGRVTPSPAP